MKRLLTVISMLQAIFGARAIMRMMRTANGIRIPTIDIQPDSAPVLAVLVPVLNEAKRLRPCLEGLIEQGSEVSQIVVIDGGSDDGTQDLAQSFCRRDPRVVLIRITPSAGENGKAHGLEAGRRAVPATTQWLLTIDADVRPRPQLATSLLAFAARKRLAALSVATTQRVSGPGEALVHPAMLATLIYRFGIPGHATSNVHDVQANGQCFLVRRDMLDRIGGFQSVTGAIAEDVELAHAIAWRGCRVGFYETDNLVDVEMYVSWSDAWRNWTRSLPLRDRYSGVYGVVGLAEVVLAQAPPLWLLPLNLRTHGRSAITSRINAALLLTRLGVLAGARRAYADPPWSYWLSPLCDLPVAALLVMNFFRRTHRWRGRTIVRGGGFR